MNGLYVYCSILEHGGDTQNEVRLSNETVRLTAAKGQNYSVQ